jgi:hypothetical protein
MLHHDLEGKVFTDGLDRDDPPCPQCHRNVEELVHGQRWISRDGLDLDG